MTEEEKKQLKERLLQKADSSIAKVLMKHDMNLLKMPTEWTEVIVEVYQQGAIDILEELGGGEKK
jgi:hypothetical protein